MIIFNCIPINRNRRLLNVRDWSIQVRIFEGVPTFELGKYHDWIEHQFGEFVNEGAELRSPEGLPCKRTLSERLKNELKFSR